MKKITIKAIRKYFVDEGFKLRHDPASIKRAVNELSKELDFDAYSIFLLLIENKPIDELHTHSYGFHTANGRYIVDKFTSLYEGWSS